MRVFNLLTIVSTVSMLVSASLCGQATATAAEGAVPWTDEWSMDLQGSERWFAEYKKVNYLEVIDSDFDDVNFLIHKDVLIQGKFKRIQNNGVELYGFPMLRMGSDTEKWSTVLDGDNVYVLGKVLGRNKKEQLRFRCSYVLRAPSDAVIIGDKLSEIDENDLDARVTFAVWVRKTGKNMGNRNIWMTASDNIVEQAVSSLAEQAEQEKSIIKLLKAMRWCTEDLSDSKRAAQLGSAAWVNTVQGEDKKRQVQEQMSKLGLTTLNGKWMTKREKVIYEFNERLSTIKVHDARAYYELAMDVVKYRDALPEALSLKHRALQEGFRNNPRSNLLRRALGKETVEASDKKRESANEFRHQGSGLAISPPQDWIRSRKAIDGDVTWLDPKSDTAYITLSVLTVGDAEAFTGIFEGRLEPYGHKVGYVSSEPESLGIGSASSMQRFSFLEGSDRRYAIIAMSYFAGKNTAVYIYVSYVEDDLASVDAAFMQVVEAVGSLGVGSVLTEDVELIDKGPDRSAQGQVEEPQKVAPENTGPSAEDLQKMKDERIRKAEEAEQARIVQAAETERLRAEDEKEMLEKHGP